MLKVLYEIILNDLGHAIHTENLLSQVLHLYDRIKKNTNLDLKNKAPAL